MTENRNTLGALLNSGGINLQRSAIFDQSPRPLPTEFDYSKVEGMILGLAVGDALGNTTEGMHPEHRHASHGEIRDYLFNHHAGRESGVCSDAWCYCPLCDGTKRVLKVPQEQLAMARQQVLTVYPTQE